jgi:DNA polymerase-3 subunit epsilon
MKALFYDTETTGLPLFKDPRQPHIVQLAASLVDLDTYAVLASMDVTIRPDGWTIPAEVAAIHGITTEIALDIGVAADTALELFLDLWNRCALRIAHNETFDARLVRISCLRHIPNDLVLHQAWKEGASECTQILATRILQLPPTEKMRKAGFLKHKSANLGEAYKFFTGVDLVGAHSAGVDVSACIAVHMAIKRGQTEARAA